MGIQGADIDAGCLDHGHVLGRFGCDHKHRRQEGNCEIVARLQGLGARPE